MGDRPPGRMTRRITIKSIARQVGVSLTTVSRALNDRPDIDPATRARVLAVAQTLGYYPSSLARSLVMQRTHTLGLAVRTIADMWVIEIVPTIEEMARAAGYEVFLSMHYADAERERHVLDTFRSRQVDGIIIISSVLGEAYPQLQEAWGIPIVLLSPQVGTPHRYMVRIDEVGGAQSAAGHLIALGHRRVGHIGVPEWALAGRDRLDGYRRALEAGGLPFDRSLVFVGDTRETGGLAGAQALLSLPDPPTAFFCFNDLTAVGTLQGARLVGLRVPQDVSLVGFDDVPLARYVDPPLTTVRQDTEGLGRRATQMLLDLIDGHATEAPVELGTQMVIRGSCAVCGPAG